MAKVQHSPPLTRSRAGRPNQNSEQELENALMPANPPPADVPPPAGNAEVLIQDHIVENDPRPVGNPLQPNGQEVQIIQEQLIDHQTPQINANPVDDQQNAQHNVPADAPIEKAQFGVHEATEVDIQWITNLLFNKTVVNLKKRFDGDRAIIH